MSSSTTSFPVGISSATLLGEAVHQNRALSIAGVLERTFTFAFRSMVYPQIWEDPRADMQALQLDNSSRMMSLVSSQDSPGALDQVSSFLRQM